MLKSRRGCWSIRARHVVCRPCLCRSWQTGRPKWWTPPLSGCYVGGQKEEEKAKKETAKRKEVQSEVQQQAADALEQARLLLEKSKRKKRRKRKLPKTSSLRRPCAQPARVHRPAMLGIMVGLDQMDCSMLVVVYGSGMCFAGLAGYDAPRVMFPSGVAKPRMLCIMAVMDQKYSAFVVNRGSGMCLVGFLGVPAPRAVFFPPVVRPRCSASPVGMDQMDIYAAK